MTVNRERMMVRKLVESADWVDSSLGYIRAKIDQAIEAYGETATLDWHQFMYDESRYLYIFADRPETDEQMAKRIEQEELLEQRRLARDRAEFERLSKQFGSQQ